MSDVDIDMEGVWPQNFSIGEAQCALGSIELKTIDETNDALIAQAMSLRRAFADVPELTFSVVPEGYRHVHHTFVMHFDGSAFGASRDDLLDILVNEYRIRAIVQYYPLYRYPLFQKLGAGAQDCPVLEAWWGNSFSLPWWSGIPDDTMAYVVSSVKAAISRLKGG
jgi:dTDP-4-amino-4,6-dideoxygalactose transaminase